MENGSSLANNDSVESQGDGYKEYSCDVLPFDAFKPLSEDDVRKLIIRNPQSEFLLGF